MPKPDKETVSNGLLFIGGVVLVTSLLFAFTAYLDLPMVTKDVITGECLRIDTPEGPLPCSELDSLKRYAEVTGRE